MQQAECCIFTDEKLQYVQLYNTTLDHRLKSWTRGEVLTRENSGKQFEVSGTLCLPAGFTFPNIMLSTYH